MPDLPEDESAGPEAALARLLAREIDVDTPEGRALLEAAGLSRPDYERLAEVSDQLEFLAVAQEAESLDDAPAAAQVKDFLSRKVESMGTPGFEAEVDPVETAPPRQPFGALGWFALAAVAAAVVFAVVQSGAPSKNDDPTDPNMGRGGGPVLSGDGPTESKVSAKYDVRTRTLFLEGLEMGPRETLGLVVEERGLDGSWTALPPHSTRSSSTIIPDGKWQQLTADRSFRLRYSVSSFGSLPSDFGPIPLEVTH